MIVCELIVGVNKHIPSKRCADYIRDKFGKKETLELIERLNDGIGSKGYKYNSHYYTILNWDRMGKDKDKKVNGKSNQKEEFKHDAEYYEKGFDG